MSFDSLGLAPALLRALADYGYTQATPIQTAAIPPALAGHDLLAAAILSRRKRAYELEFVSRRDKLSIPGGS